MKKTPITLKFDSAKLKALQYYLPKNGMTVEEELQKYLDEIYDEKVPQDVKDFVHFQSGNSDSPEENEQDQTADGSDSDGKDGKKQSRSKKNDQTLEPDSTLNQGMTMKM